MADKVSSLGKSAASKNNENADWWSKLTKAQKADIKAGLKDLDNGRKRDFKEVLSKY